MTKDSLAKKLMPLEIQRLFVDLAIKNDPNGTAIKLLQYHNLRFNFQKVVETILGPNYYNMSMDVYGCDEKCCEDIIQAYKDAKKRWWKFW